MSTDLNLLPHYIKTLLNKYFTKEKYSIILKYISPDTNINVFMNDEYIKKTSKMYFSDKLITYNLMILLYFFKLLFLSSYHC